MKQILHTGYQGIEKTKSNVRSTMYWHNIDKNIDEMISNCNKNIDTSILMKTSCRMKCLRMFGIK